MQFIVIVMLDVGSISIVRTDPASILLAEHAHGREFCALAEQLVAHDAADLPWISVSAGRLLHYFEGELKVHQEDEEDLLAKALVGLDRSLAATIGVMATQHAMLRDAAALVVVAWGDLEARPERLSVYRPTLGARTARLLSMSAIHLELEEQLLYPRLQELPTAELRDICAELQVRRALAY